MPLLCPIAAVSSCKACPIFKVCPVKSYIGDDSGHFGEAPPKHDASAEKKGSDKKG